MALRTLHPTALRAATFSHKGRRPKHCIYRSRQSQRLVAGSKGRAKHHPSPLVGEGGREAAG
ncbi:hypothetical protein GCM10011491_32310 [Brucella endophytica]|uniref:Uncharacterized protein n=1 Tax=Brucella endophytica TaxID=1963359 RepID=A0A916SIX1_9HYPH|nr:hypothetical protein GCM10011491_32310 [Brucella endophytica]